MDTLIDIAADIAPFTWPLVVMVGLLFILRKVETTVNPIVESVVRGVASSATGNALTYGLAIGYGLSASLQSLSEQATLLHWPIIAALAKVVNPCIVAMLAFAAKSDLTGKAPKPPGSTVSTAPFPTPPPAASS